MTITIYYKDPKIILADCYECDQWGIDNRNSLVKLYKKGKCFFFVRLTEIRKVEIDYET